MDWHLQKPDPKCGNSRLLVLNLTTVTWRQVGSIRKLYECLAPHAVVRTHDVLHRQSLRESSDRLAHKFSCDVQATDTESLKDYFCKFVGQGEYLVRSILWLPTETSCTAVAAPALLVLSSCGGGSLTFVFCIDCCRCALTLFCTI